jgi:DNA-binding transcriptional ArsR family regulator
MAAKKLKTAEQMQRHFKGIANHYRIKMLLLISKHEGLTVRDFSEILNTDIKNASQHTRYLLNSGLIQKRHRGRSVEHSLSPYGKFIVKFIKEFERIN